MNMEDRKAEYLLQLVYDVLLKKPTGPYLYEASLTRLATKTNKSVDYIRNWFEARRESDPRKHEVRPIEYSDKLSTIVTRHIQFVIETFEKKVLKYKKSRTIPKCPKQTNIQVASEEGPFEPKQKRPRLEKPEKINLNAEKTLKFIYYNLLCSENGPYLYDACLKNLAKKIGLTEEEIKNWFTEKRYAQKYAHIEIPEAIDGVSKDEFLEQIINEAILDEELIENPKPFQLPNIHSSDVQVEGMFKIARLLYRRDKEDTRNVKILNHIHTTLPNLSKCTPLSLTDIRFLSEKMEVSAPSLMEWFEANQKRITTEIPVENIRMSEAIFKQMRSAEATPSGSSTGAASSSFAGSSNGGVISTSSTRRPISTTAASEKNYEMIAAPELVPNPDGRMAVLDRETIPTRRTKISEPEPKRPRLEKPEKIHLNAEKTLKFIYYNLLCSENGPYLYDACLKNLAKKIGLTEEEIKKWFMEKRDSQKCSLLEIPEPIDGVTKDELLEQIIAEAILDEESIEHPKPFQLPKTSSSTFHFEVMFESACLIYGSENYNTRRVYILDYIHTKLPELFKGTRISLGAIRFLSEKMEVSAPSIMEWFEANQKRITSEIPVENIRMSEAIFKQMRSVEAASSSFAGSSNGGVISTSSNKKPISTTAAAVMKMYKLIAGSELVPNDDGRVAAFDHETIPTTGVHHFENSTMARVASSESDKHRTTMEEEGPSDNDTPPKSPANESDPRERISANERSSQLQFPDVESPVEDEAALESSETSLSMSGFTAPIQKDSESPFEDEEDVVDFVETSKSFSTHDTGNRTPSRIFFCNEKYWNSDGVDNGASVEDEEESDDEESRNDVEGEGPGINELISDTDEEDNQESVRNGKELLCLDNCTSGSDSLVSIDPRAPESCSAPPTSSSSGSPQSISEPASSAHDAFDDDEDVESKEPPANNSPLPATGSVSENGKEDDHFVEEPEPTDYVRNWGLDDNVDYSTSPAPLVPLEDSPVCKVTKQVVTITRSPPCFFTDTEEWCQHCARIYEERQKRHEELYQIISKFKF
ncbi:hypothetical protein GCK72_015189 [Caenorhabditis remanei]|uniref:Homeobox domain-containing protein n=1 Tax=Caenorhabditis remanei TaxID=31234 RepID=A0A6A5GVZ9_CAERE|nr:hypothetical protein GCK72_015189 [Caenorhabditis remanei]KAF1758729.1 hypothetical protein GCK72_015189 [Caenorhabditis remanei]